MTKDAAIGFQIKSLSNLIYRSMGEMSPESDCGITGIQSFVILYIYDHAQNGPVLQRDLEKFMDVRRSTITEILKLMERNGLITRASVSFDLRQKMIALTPKAVALRKGIIQRLDQMETHMRREISEDELSAFFCTVRKIKNNLESPEVTHFDIKHP